MASRGKKLEETKKEQAKAIVMLNPDISERDLAREVGIGNSTAHSLKVEIINNDADAYEQARAAKKKEFIDEAWEVVQKALKLANKRFSKALDDEAEIEALISTIKDEDLTQAQKKSLISRLTALQMTNIRDIAVAMGTIYDKGALAAGEPTVISDRKDPTSDLIKEMDEKLESLKRMTGQLDQRSA